MAGVISSDLALGDDGLPVEVVGSWVRDKHEYLKRYINITKATRRKYIGPGKAGATFIDVFCACGRAKIKGTGEFVDGSPLVAWQTSVSTGAPYSGIYIADRAADRRDACQARLEMRGANVVAVEGEAIKAVESYRRQVNPFGLHFAFLDPHSLGALNFEIIRTLAQLKRIDMLIHVSAMDLQRNLDRQISDGDAAAFDQFAPGWREAVDTSQSARGIRAALLEYWKGLVEKLDYSVSSTERTVKGNEGQRLYWLMFAARHKLAHNLWDATGRADGQKEMF